MTVLDNRTHLISTPGIGDVYMTRVGRGETDRHERAQTNKSMRESGLGTARGSQDACLSLDGKRLNPLQYAWDGMTLWLNETFSHPAELKLEFRTE